MSRTLGIPGISATTQPFPQIKLILVQMIKQRTLYKTMMVNNGMDALKLARFFKCHLFLLDYQQPDMHGFELYDRLHALKGHEETPALLLSGTFFLERPFTGLTSLEMLLQTTHYLLDPEDEDFTLVPKSRQQLLSLSEN
jgi:CheY-like chemotaxis protein